MSLPVNGDAVVVPLSVEAMSFGLPDLQNTPLAGAHVDFSRLTREEFRAGSLSFLGQRGATLGDVGVHLHWALPQPLTTGEAAKDTAEKRGEIDFPPAPNRWLVVRLPRNGSKVPSACWIVESDFCSFEPQWNGVTVPVDPATGYARAYLGRSVPLARWTDRGEAQSVQRVLGWKLTAIGWGDPAFAAYYPSCRNVFGFHDALTGPDGRRLSEREELNYVVVGWHSNPADDPLRHQAKRTEPLPWALPNDADGEQLRQQTRTLYRGMALRVAWDESAAGFQTSSSSVLAMGNSVQESLAAMAAAGVDRADASNTERIVNALLAGLDKSMPVVDNQASHLDASLHMLRYLSIEAGSNWIARPRERPAEALRKPEDGAFDPFPDGDEFRPLPEALSLAVGRYSALQKEHDYAERLWSARRRRIRDGMSQLERMNWDPKSCGIANRESWSPIRVALRDRLSRDLTDFYGIDLHGLSVRLSMARAEVDSILAGEPEFEVVQIPAPRFWRPRDPSVIVRDADLRAGDRYEDPSLYPEPPESSGFEGVPRTTLRCQLLSALPAPSSEVQDILSIDGTLFLPDPLALATLIAQAIRQAGQGGPAAPVTWRPMFARWSARYDSTVPFVAETIQGVIETAGNGPDGSVWLTVDGRLVAVPAHLANDIMLPGVHLEVRARPYTGAKLKREYWLTVEVVGFSATGSVLDAITGEAPIRPAASACEPTLPIVRDRQPELRDEWSLQATARDTSELQPRNAPSHPGRGLRFTGFGLVEPAMPGEMVRTLDSRLKSSGIAKAPHLGDTETQARHTVAHSLNGLHDQMLMKQPGFNLPMKDRARLLHLFEIPRSIEEPRPGDDMHPNPRAERFVPVRGGWLQLTSLEMIDVFGRVKKIDLGQSVMNIAASLSPPSPRPGLAVLPPRLTVPARLSFRLISASSRFEAQHHHAPDSPVCGWVIGSVLERGLTLCAPGGLMVGSLRMAGEKVQFALAPGRIRDDLHPQFLEFANALQADRRRFDQMIDTIDRQVASIVPEQTGRGAGPAIVTGRPLAVVLAEVGVDLHGELSPRSQTLDPSVINQREEQDPFDLAMPVQFGDPSRKNDGLAAFYIADAGQPFDYDDLWSPDANLRDPALRSPTLHIALHGRGRRRRLMMLMDPHAPVHAAAGILPIKAITLPPAHFAAYRNLGLLFPCGPLLLPAAPELSLPLSPIEGHNWFWADQRPVPGKDPWSPLVPTPALEAATELPDAVAIKSRIWLTLRPGEQTPERKAP